MQKIMSLGLFVLLAGMFPAGAEVVITAPTGLPDESDVALEAAVDAVKSVPEDAVSLVGDTVLYIHDEIRNTAHGVKSAFAGDTPREAARVEMLHDVTEAWDASDEVVMRTYAVSDAVGSQLAPKADGDSAAVNVSDFFTGIEFPDGASAFYRPNTRQLVLFNTQANLCAAEDLLARLHRAERNYQQVEIQAKFVEVSQSTLNELGFTWTLNEDTALFDDWTLNGGQELLTAGLRSASDAFLGAQTAGTMTLTKDGWMPLDLVIRALEQADDSDVLSAPSLTAMNGKTAEIWVGERRNVPQAFSVNSTDVNVHIEHKKWNSEIMGVQFKVKADIEKDNQIRLQLNPKVVDLIGYDSYQVSPEANMLAINGFSIEQSGIDGAYPILDVPAAGISKLSDLISATLPGWSPNVVTAAAGDSTAYNWGNNAYLPHDEERIAQHETEGKPLAPVIGSLPYFRVREISTEVVVADGNTVGLGGLIYDRNETYKDKVPVLGSIPLLGRLFRSEGERSIKRNLMIFVSATQVDSNGQRKTDIASSN